LQESHYRRYAENLEQAQIDRALEAERISNISIVQPPTYDPEPVRPRLPVYFGLGLFVAVLGSLGLAVLAEHRNPAPRPPAEPDALGGFPALARRAPANGAAGDGAVGGPETPAGRGVD